MSNQIIYTYVGVGIYLEVPINATIHQSTSRDKWKETIRHVQPQVTNRSAEGLTERDSQIYICYPFLYKICEYIHKYNNKWVNISDFLLLKLIKRVFTIFFFVT